MADDDNEAEQPAAEEQGGESVQDVEFPDLAGAGAVAETAPNIDMIRDIEVVLTVELGRTNMLIEEVLGLTPGQVIELEKLAGEPLDILINDKLLARGEVVVVDDNFGVRITSIVDPRSRVQALGPASSGEEAEV